LGAVLFSLPTVGRVKVGEKEMDFLVYALIEEMERWKCESCEKPVEPYYQFCEECEKYLEEQRKEGVK
jgi:predicted amidophosphoribosyltransferase